MKRINTDIKVEYDKEILQRIRKRKEWLTATSSMLFLSFLGAIVSLLTYSPTVLLWSIVIFVVDLFVHLAIVGKIYRLEQEGAWICSLARDFPINFLLTSNQLPCTNFS